MTDVTARVGHALFQPFYSVQTKQEHGTATPKSPEERESPGREQRTETTEAGAANMRVRRVEHTMQLTTQNPHAHVVEWVWGRS